MFSGDIETRIVDKIFEFSDKTYKEICGTTIDRRFAPPNAILFTAASEEKIFK